MRKLKLDELNRLSVEDFQSAPKVPVIVVLDNIRSAHNVGSFFRTSDALAVESILLTGISARPPHKEINKAAIGATHSVTWTYAEDIVSALKELKERGYKIIGVEQTDRSVMLDDFHADSAEKYAVVFGNEVDGIGEGVLPLLDVCLEIPQYGTKHSFNVSVCGGIVLWGVCSGMRR